MKKLYVYLFLVLFTLQTPSWADDIRDFQIEGMSIGDSLLDFYDVNILKNIDRFYYPNSKKYFGIVSTIFDKNLDKLKTINYNSTEFIYNKLIENCRKNSNEYVFMILIDYYYELPFAK